jgi:hypothetical protein
MTDKVARAQIKTIMARVSTGRKKRSNAAARASTVEPDPQEDKKISKTLISRAKRTPVSCDGVETLISSAGSWTSGKTNPDIIDLVKQAWTAIFERVDIRQPPTAYIDLVAAMDHQALRNFKVMLNVYKQINGLPGFLKDIDLRPDNTGAGWLGYDEEMARTLQTLGKLSKSKEGCYFVINVVSRIITTKF